MLKAIAIVVVVAALVIAIKVDHVQCDVGGGDWSLEKTTVRVQNDLGGSTLLIFHCRSADTDLDEKIIHSGQFVEWSFHVNLRGTTLFWCQMKWDAVQRNFVIYDAQKDEGTCTSKCWRSIRPDGGYFYHEDKNYWEKRYIWGLKPSASSHFSPAQVKNETAS